ncbi:uncharacterized protein LOC141541370 [Sminthopsis crassicaudata]|uniref:uncharacterized protein LOC141541370 n=1 Tax=Sminthopsis crassicaudata TaxID=9301 RepID=UPI003D68286B
MWISAFKQLILANISAPESSTNWLTNNTPFERRLSLLPDNSLMLHNLRVEDSGCYEAEIKSFLGEIITQKFNLTVLENDSANFNKNLGIIMAVIIILLIVLACYLSRKLPGSRFSCFSSRGEPHTEENGHFQMASSRTNEESQRMLKALPFATIQEDVVEMQNGLGTQPENSRDQHRQELPDEEKNNTESMDHRRTAQIEAA